MNKILIVGLGNPGRKYNHTPHNAGFETIDKLIKNFREENFILKSKNTKQATIYEGKINHLSIVVAKPLLFMNNSGNVVKMLIENYEIKNIEAELWVIHDDIDLPLGSIKISTESGSAGHNGIQNIINKISSKNFVKFRIGILLASMPQKRSPEFMSKFVTKKLKRGERKILEEAQIECANMIKKRLNSSINIQ